MLDPLPGEVFARRTTIGIADAVFPVVPAGKVSARPAIDCGVELLEQFQGVSPQALDVVGRHQRKRAYVEEALAAGGFDPQAAAVVKVPAVNANRVFA